MNSESRPPRSARDNVAPADLAEAATSLLDMLRHDDENERVYAMLDKDTDSTFSASVHMGIGMWMRNQWGLWKQTGPLHDYIRSRYYLTHPDDMSGMVLLATHQIYNTGILDEAALRERAARYLDHWCKTLRGEI